MAPSCKSCAVPATDSGRWDVSLDGCGLGPGYPVWMSGAVRHEARKQRVRSGTKDED